MNTELQDILIGFSLTLICFLSFQVFDRKSNWLKISSMMIISTILFALLITVLEAVK